MDTVIYSIKMLKSTGTLNLSMFRKNWDVVVTNEFHRV